KWMEQGSLGYRVLRAASSSRRKSLHVMGLYLHDGLCNVACLPYVGLRDAGYLPHVVLRAAHPCPPTHAYIYV
ncbi:hypothetical protein HAX54_033053, partial [Datura stramonium]|nr:hypothetical protein [Datura stramonium]